jgi:hypothetical protein
MKPAHNSTLAIGGVSSPLDSFVVAESSVLRTNFCIEKPAHRQSAKRCTKGSLRSPSVQRAAAAARCASYYRNPK